MASEVERGPLPAAIEAAVIDRGQTIVLQAFGLLSSNLLQAIQVSGISNALPYCSAQAMPLTALVARTNGVALRRVSHKVRNPANRATSDELALIGRYTNELASGTAPRPVAIATSASTATFYAPIVITHQLCLQCHGELDRDLSLDNLLIIRKIYPRDEATGFRLGEVRGLWRIDFDRARFE
jgi:hypothetical protein